MSAVRLALPLFLLGQAAWAQADYVQSLRDQKFILSRVGDHESLKLKKNELDRVTGTCDIVVQVMKAGWKKRAAHIQVTQLGSPTVTARPPGQCSGKGTREVEIYGFSDTEPPDTVSAAVSAILKTPEEYLAEKGISFTLPPESDEQSEPQVKTPGSSGSTPPKVLLKVDAAYTEAARRSRTQGTVTFRFVVGADGRAHNPQILQGIGHGLDENALRVLALWRFEPSRRDGKPVSSSASGQMTFRLL